MPTIIINQHQLTQAIYLGILFFILSCSKKDSSPVIVRPSAPTNIEATAGDGQATIRFSPPTNNGGANIIGYTVVSVPGNITASGLQSPITITGLTNGVTYQFKVVATNSSGIGDESVLSNSITPIAAIIVNRTCSVVSISRYNNGTQSDYAMTVFYDFINRPVRMIMYDSLRKVKEYEASFVYQSDAIVIDQNQSFKIDPTTQQIRSFITRDNLADPNSDVFLYEYIYNDSGYLTTKNKFINGSQKPIYTTTYVYDNNNLLIGCNMVLTSTNQKLLESTITYETSKIIKSFIYNFPDGFESFKFSPILNFGKKMKYPVKTMVTKLYDPSRNTILDTWTSSFGSYSYTSNNYINQGTQTGDLQQGFGMFYGKTSFTYLCQ
jgi:hypothetical protein